MSQVRVTSNSNAVDMASSLPHTTARRLHLNLHGQARAGYTSLVCSIDDPDSGNPDPRQLTAQAQSVAALVVDSLVERLPFDDSVQLLARCHHALLTGAEFAVTAVDIEACAENIVKAIDFAAKTRALGQLYGSGQRDGWYRTKLEHVLTTLGFEIEDAHQLEAKGDIPPRVELRARKRAHLSEEALAIRCETLRDATAHPLEAAGLSAQAPTSPTPSTTTAAPSAAPKIGGSLVLEDVKQLASQVEQALSSGQLERAHSAALMLLEQIPHDGDIMVTVANIETALGHLGSAEAHLIKATFVAEHNPHLLDDVKRSLESLARRFEQRGERDRAALIRDRISRPSAAASSASFSVVVLCFNQLEHTKLCLDSIVERTLAPYELIVVDNNSSDGTADYLRSFAEKHEQVRLVLNSANLGFAGGNNCGMAIARGDFVVLLNNDTVVTEGWLQGMLATFERNPSSMLVGPRSNHVTGVQLVPSPSYRDLNQLPDFAKEWAEQHRGQDELVPRVIGFCLAIRRALIEEVGGLDEIFGRGNFEDDDYCLRARAKGHQVFVAHEVFVHHTGGQTFKGENVDYSESIRANWTIFKRKWGIDPARDLAQGYSHSLTAPASAVVPIPLPAVDTTYSAERDGQILVQAASTTDTTQNAADPAQHRDARSAAFDEAESAAAANDWPRAVALFQAMTEAYPEFAPGYVGLGSSLFALGEADLGGDALERACELEPQNLPLRVQLGVTMAHAGKLQRAETAFVKVLNSEPDHLDALLSLAELCRVSSHMSEALELLNHASRVHPTEPDVIAAIRQLALDLGDEDGARAAEGALREIAPDHPALERA